MAKNAHEQVFEVNDDDPRLNDRERAVLLRAGVIKTVSIPRHVPLTQDDLMILDIALGRLGRLRWR